MTSLASRFLGIHKGGPPTSDSARVVRNLLDKAAEAEERYEHLRDAPPFIIEFESIESTVNMTGGLCMVSSPHRVIRASGNWEKFLGWTEEELKRRDWVEFVHPDDLPRSEAAAREMSAGQQLPPFVNRWMRKDGSWMTFAWTATPYINGLCFAMAIPSPCAECPI